MRGMVIMSIISFFEPHITTEPGMRLWKLLVLERDFPSWRLPPYPMRARIDGIGKRNIETHKTTHNISGREMTTLSIMVYCLRINQFRAATNAEDPLVTVKWYLGNFL